MPVFGHINPWLFSQNNNPAIFGGSSYPSILDDGNTVGWYDMAEDYMTKDGSNLVSQWADRSGLDHHLLQAVGIQQPLWSTDGVLFDGVNDFMRAGAFTLVQPTYIYMVFRQKTWTSNDRISDGNINNIGAIYQGGATPTLRLTAGIITTISPPLNTFGVLQVLFNGAASKRKWNHDNDVEVNTGTGDMGGYTLGARYDGLTAWGHFEVKEVIIRKSADNLATDTIIYDYLKDKYSL